ncbi:SpoIIE family protein phosphatase [Kineococcus sp. LSe6-4]|uniref:SpoIIE family protein phosphatase n=1 Tax=Kineococcus halophytocola TaxID=3234027 RepID=A0ABV4H3E1_9ACTN
MPQQQDHDHDRDQDHVPAYGEVDLTTCESEPIHVPGAIQPHGLLLALDGRDHRVVVASENTAGLLGRAPGSVLGADLAELLGADVAARVLQAQEDDNREEALHARLVLGGAEVDVDVVVHVSGERTVVEVEPVGPDAAPVSYRATRGAIARLAGTSGIEALCRRLAREARTVLGFDRVMVYRFDAQWNGEVVAEDHRPGLEPFLGLRYPASDIPAQARRLYALNWTRLIADAEYRPVRLEPLVDPGTGAPLDLSHSVLRSVSPIHLEYLHNMGVTASMSISLIVDGRLWGLVACHHYSGPHRPGYDARSAAEFLGQTASQLVGERARSHERDEALAAQELMSDLLAQVSALGRDPLTSLVEDGRVVDLLGAGGVAVWDGNRLLTAGRVPPWAHVQRIARLLGRADGAVTFTDHLATLDPRLREVAGTASGALRIGLDGNGWMLWLRPEQPETVSWGGDPHEAKTVEVEGSEARISPRKSFEKWQEVVRGRSLPWRPWHASTAERLRSQLTAIMLGRSRDQIAIAESLQRAVVLDEAPEVPGLDVHARYRPAAGGQLGGDWWDLLPLEGGRVAVVVGDVAGHGVHAAAAMAQLRTALRAYLLEGHSPAAALDRLDALVATLNGNHTATALVGVVSPGDGSGAGAGAVVELASAGHPPPLLVSAEGASSPAIQTRPVLGLGFGPTHGGPEEVSTLPVPAEAVLLFFSDGLVERRGASLTVTTVQLGQEAARAVAQGLDTAQVADRLLTAVPGRAEDDTTLVLARLARDHGLT